MKKYEFYIKDDARGYIGESRWIREYRNFSVALGIMTKTLNRFARVYGHYPREYGVKTIADGVQHG